MNPLFEKQMKELLHDEYDAFMNALSEPPYKGIYLNPKYKNVISYLNQQHLHPHPYIKDSYYFHYAEEQLGKSPFFLCGCFYIQEPSAMLVNHFLDVKEDDYILDMCGAPGGKTCAIASRLSQEGLMITNDIVPLRAKILSENVERFGLTNTIVTNSDPRDFQKDLSGFFDKIILDAPCSGEGMFRKNDMAIETWSLEKIDKCVHIQRKLIDTAMSLLKPGGELIYSTCTYNTSENEQQIQYLIEHYDCSLVPLKKQQGMCEGIGMKEAVRLYPHHYRGEGHFIALIKKHGQETIKKRKALSPSLSRQEQQLIEQFYTDYLKTKVPAYLYSNQHHLYAIAPHFPQLEKIRILRNGLYLGECKKNRFEPSFALSHTLTLHDVRQSYIFHENDERIKKYIHGETLEGTNQKGYGLIFVEDFPLSFYKESQHQIKNLYPKGLRR